MNILESKKNLIIALLIIIIAVGTWLVIVSNDTKKQSINNNTPEVTETKDTETEIDEVMDLVVYLQDKNAAISSDCGITYPKNIQVPKTTAVADASLTYLFENELSKYGNYESVVIKDSVAEVTISNDNYPSGRKISSLSSCESSHLFTVLEDTLTQYEAITSVDLFSPSGKIEF